MVVEPMAGDRLEDNLNPVGRLYYSASTMICVPTSLAQETGPALGAQAGEKRLAEVIRSGGFSSVRRAAEDSAQHGPRGQVRLGRGAGKGRPHGRVPSGTIAGRLGEAGPNRNRSELVNG